jgi:hypothetical protein
VDLGHKKYSVRRRRDLGSQWGRKERVAAMKSDGNLPLLPRLRCFSGELARAGQGEREHGMQRGELTEESRCEDGQMASREGEERGAWDLFAHGDLGLV